LSLIRRICAMVQEVKDIINIYLLHEKMFRLNKCLPMLSRRGADQIIEQRRVQVNAMPVSLGAWISYGDILTVDGQVIEWERVIQSKMEHSLVSPLPSLTPLLSFTLLRRVSRTLFI
jgi:hypothetical protein